MKTEITITEPTGNAMHHHYPNQTSAQPAYIELNPETGNLSASYNGEIGNAVPMAVWHGKIRRYACPVLPDDRALELMEEITPLAERVCAGFSETWDGNNYVGKLTDDAETAEEEIGNIVGAIDYDETLKVWDASEWLNGVTIRRDGSVEIDGFGMIKAETTEDEIDAMANKIDADASGEGIFLDNSTAVAYLRDLREECN